MFFSPLVLKAQRTEADFKWLFFSRIEQLDRIEGIYDLSLKVQHSFGPIDCKCLSNDYFKSSFDRVAIYKEDDQLKVYSIKRGIQIGLIELKKETSKFATEPSSHKFINYGSRNYFSSKGWEYEGIRNIRNITLFTSTIEVRDKFQYFDADIASYLKFECYNKKGMCEVLSGIALLKTTATLNRIFPNSYEQPPTYASTGSGVVISKEGFVFTNKHVVEQPPIYDWNEEKLCWEDVTKSTYYGPGKFNASVGLSIDGIAGDIRAIIAGDTFELMPIWRDSYKDLAFLKIINPPPNLATVTFDTTVIPVGKELYTLGFPIASNLGGTIKYTNGYYSSDLLVNSHDKNEKLQVLNMSVNPGNSGGGIFDQKTGNLIGIITSRLNDAMIGHKTEGIAFGTSVTDAVRLLKSNYVFRAPVKEYVTVKGKPKQRWSTIYWGVKDDSIYKFKYSSAIRILIRNKNYMPNVSVKNNQDATVQIIVK